MALTADEQALLNVAMAALPAWYKHDERRLEDLAGAAKCIGAALATSKYWMGQTLILGATGPTATDPDWLNQHARDRGTSRQGGETDAELAARLRDIPDALTRPALLEAAQAIIDAAGVVGTVTMVELRRDRAFLITNLADQGTGGTFTVGPPATFEPDAGFNGPPYRDAYPGDTKPAWLVISGAADAGNDGAFPITGIAGNAAEYTNATQVAAADPTCTWRVNRYGPLIAELLTPVATPRVDAYCDRGHRCGPDNAAFVMMLPFGTTEATRLQVAEMVRIKKAAGVYAVVERRQNP